MNLSIPQTIIAVVSILGVVALGADHIIGGDAVVAFLSLVAGSSLGYVNGKKVATREAHATSLIAAHLSSQNPATIAPEPTP